MNFIFLLLLFSVCLFILFILSKRDFVLLRKNISVGEIFDLALLSFAAAFFLGRIFYIINSLQFSLLTPIKFFYIIKFPGFSFLGFFLSGAATIYFSFRKTKALSRIYDIFSLSFFPVLITSVVFFKYPFMPFYGAILLFIILIALFISFLQSHDKYFMRDGGISLITISLFSFHTFLVEFFVPTSKIFILSFLQWISIFVLIVSIGVFFVTQKIFAKK